MSRTSIDPRPSLSLLSFPRLSMKIVPFFWLVTQRGEWQWKWEAACLMKLCYLFFYALPHSVCALFCVRALLTSFSLRLTLIKCVCRAGLCGEGGEGKRMRGSPCRAVLNWSTFKLLYSCLHLVYNTQVAPRQANSLPLSLSPSIFRLLSFFYIFLAFFFAGL